MSAKQGNGRNRINTKRIALYAVLVTVCLIVGYLENLLSITLTVAIPGAKIGLSNAVALTLVCRGDIKGAWAINITRICLSALLFGSPVSFLFSVAGGVTSLFATCILSKIKFVSEIGIGIVGGTVHNIFQCVAAITFVGTGAVYYLPLLLCLGAICGAFCGILVKLVLNKIKINGIL